MIKKLGPLCLIALILITALGLYMRCESVFGTKVSGPLRRDAKDYFFYAYNLRLKGTYSRTMVDPANPMAPVLPDSVRSPGYPLFLLPFVDGLPTQHMLAKIVMSQAIMSTLTILLAFFFFLKFLPRSGALVASLLTALSPHLIVGNSYVLTESLFCFLLVLSASLLSILRTASSSLRAGVAGVLIGIAALVRPILYFFPIVAVIPLIHAFGRKTGFRLGASLLLAFLLTLSPWVARNFFVQPEPGNNSLMIDFLHHGIYPDFMYNNDPGSYAFPHRYDPRSPEISASSGSVLKEVLTRTIGHPGLYLKWFLIGKPLQFWSWNTVQGVGDAFLYPVTQTPYLDDMLFERTRTLMLWLHWPLVALCLFGSLLVWNPRILRIFDPGVAYVARLASCCILYFTVLHMIGAPFPRYAFPLRPFQFGMAVFSVVLIYRHFRKRFRRPAEIANITA